LLAFSVLEVGFRQGKSVSGVLALPGKVENVPTANAANPNVMIPFICPVMFSCARFVLDSAVSRFSSANAVFLISVGLF
jgi:hypothetical protein